MTREEILEKLQGLAAKHQPVPRSLTVDMRLVEDLALDSIARLGLVVEVENFFEVILEPEDEASIDTVGDLVGVIAEKLA